MNNLSQRLKKRYDMTITNWKSDCHFSLKLALLRVADDLTDRMHIEHISSYFHKAKNKWIFSYLNGCLESTLKKYSTNNYTGEREMNAPVWVCWWTGEESAPLLVKQCIASICKNAGNHPVHLITKNNYREFLQIPTYILNKAQNGQMKTAHLSDYIRVKLLAQYGGLWLDATIFCSEQIPEWYFDQPIFTCKSNKQKGKWISEYRWVTFCLGGWRGNVFYQFLAEAFEVYWATEAVAIDYLFFDYIILLAYEQIRAVHNQLEQIPLNNIHRDDLQKAMNAGLPATEFNNIIRPDTAIYKLSWRESYQERTSDNEMSVYGYFLHLKL